jgi:hypothetical protein
MVSGQAIALYMLNVKPCGPLDQCPFLNCASFKLWPNYNPIDVNIILTSGCHIHLRETGFVYLSLVKLSAFYQIQSDMMDFFAPLCSTCQKIRLHHLADAVFPEPTECVGPGHRPELADSEPSSSPTLATTTSTMPETLSCGPQGAQQIRPSS